MRRPTISELPPPPLGKVGWPWTDETPQLPETMPNGSLWPRISIVTPSYNQGQFIEETIRSVLLQGYLAVEHIVVDGGSTDQTLSILKKYDGVPGFRWVSEPDRGQSDAVNKGLCMATGDWIGWQNSDDFYLPNSFKELATAMLNYLQYQGFYSNVLHVDLTGGIVGRSYASRPSAFVHRYRSLTFRNQSLFLKSTAWRNIGFLNVELQCAMDHDLAWRLLRRRVPMKHIPSFWAAFRRQPASKSARLRNLWEPELGKIYGGTRFPIDFP